MIPKEAQAKENEDSLEFIWVKHNKCGRVWRVTRNALEILWCPHCKTSNKFVEAKLRK